jgi:hypothetical protein
MTGFFLPTRAPPSGGVFFAHGPASAPQPFGIPFWKEQLARAQLSVL